MLPPLFNRGASDLLTCPLCLSVAVSTAEHEEADEPNDGEWPVRSPGPEERLMIRCAECGTWRAVTVDTRGARTVQRQLRRDRRRMARALRRLEHAG